MCEYASVLIILSATKYRTFQLLHPMNTRRIHTTPTTTNIHMDALNTHTHTYWGSHLEAEHEHVVTKARGKACTLCCFRVSWSFSITWSHICLWEAIQRELGGVKVTPDQQVFPFGDRHASPCPYHDQRGWGMGLNRVGEGWRKARAEGGRVVMRTLCICVQINDMTGRRGREGHISNNRSYHPHSGQNRDGYNGMSQDLHGSRTAYVTSPGAAAVTSCAEMLLNCSSVRYFQLSSSSVFAVSYRRCVDVNLIQTLIWPHFLSDIALTEWNGKNWLQTNKTVKRRCAGR